MPGRRRPPAQAGSRHRLGRTAAASVSSMACCWRSATRSRPAAFIGQSNAESTRVFGNPYGRPDEVHLEDPQRARLVYHVLVNGMVEVPLLLTISDVGEQVAWNGFLSLRDVEQVFDASSEAWNRLLRAGRLWTPDPAFNHAVHDGKLEAIRRVQRLRSGWSPSDAAGCKHRCSSKRLGCYRSGREPQPAGAPAATGRGMRRRSAGDAAGAAAARAAGGAEHGDTHRATRDRRDERGNSLAQQQRLHYSVGGASASPRRRRPAGSAFAGCAALCRAADPPATARRTRQPWMAGRQACGHMRRRVAHCRPVGAKCGQRGGCGTLGERGGLPGAAGWRR